MNHPVRIRMQGGVGRAGEKLALTRFSHLVFFPSDHKSPL
jgi:hypothetical protein